MIHEIPLNSYIHVGLYHHISIKFNNILLNNLKKIFSYSNHWEFIKVLDKLFNLYKTYHFFRYHGNLLRGATKYLCAAAWLVSIFLAVTVFLWNRCEADDNTTSGLDPIYIQICIGLPFWLVIGVASFLYFRIYRKASNGFPAEGMSSSQKNRWIGETRTSKLAFMSLLVFFICWLPLVLTVQLMAAVPVHSAVLCAVCLLAYAQAGVNAVFYYKRSIKYKQAFQKTCFSSKEIEL